MSFMKYKKFGKDGIAISEVGLGCWQIASVDWGEVSASGSRKNFRRIISKRSNFL